MLSLLKETLLDEKWHGAHALCKLVGADMATTTARVRDLRKPEFGGFTVHRRRIGFKSWKAGGHVDQLRTEYRLIKQGTLGFDADQRNRHRCPSCGGKGYKTGGRCK